MVGLAPSKLEWDFAGGAVHNNYMYVYDIV